jgi:hypothetical protein
MSISLMKRVAVYITLMFFTFGQISGCLTVPAVPSSWKSLIEDGTTSFKGETSRAVYDNSLSGKRIFERFSGGPVAMGYNTSEFQGLYQRFAAAKKEVAAAGDGITRSQFLELSTATADLLSYMDVVEALQSRGVPVKTQGANLDAYTVAPGEKISLFVDGFCLDKKLPAAPGGEPFRLEPVTQFISPELLSTYQSVIDQHQAKPVRSGVPSYRADTDTQSLMWALRGMKTGELDRRMLNAMPERQKAILRGSDPEAYSKMMADAKVKEVIRGLNDAFEQSVIGQGYSALQGMSNGNPEAFLTDPSVMADPARLDSAMAGWQERQRANSRNHVPSPYSSPYTMLQSGVAARAVGTDFLRTGVEVVNMGSEPFVFKPTDYVMNSRSQSQAVAPGRWIQTDADRVAYDGGGNSDDVTAMIAKDFLELTAMRSLDSLAPTGNLGKMISGMGDLFSSKAVRNLLLAAPVVGNVINLGMLMTGKNLDGSDMGATDYIMAGLGVLPVAGNVTRLLRPAGAKVFAKELSTVDRFFDRYDKPLLVADVLTTNSGDYLIEHATGPSWMREATQQATSQVGAAINSSMPQTANYMKSQGLAL